MYAAKYYNNWDRVIKEGDNAINTFYDINPTSISIVTIVLRVLLFFNG